MDGMPTIIGQLPTRFTLYPEKAQFAGLNDRHDFLWRLAQADLFHTSDRSLDTRRERSRQARQNAKSAKKRCGKGGRSIRMRPQGGKPFLLRNRSNQSFPLGGLGILANFALFVRQHFFQAQSGIFRPSAAHRVVLNDACGKPPQWLILRHRPACPSKSAARGRPRHNKSPRQPPAPAESPMLR